MKIIISPAKKMNSDQDFMAPKGLPKFIDRAEDIINYLGTLSYDELKAIWKCNDAIAAQNSERIQNMNLRESLVPALLSYEGLQYQYMAPQVFDNAQWEYVGNHLVILSGLYGALKPLDGISPYRLEMLSKFEKPLENHKNLYSYWGDALYQELKGHSILNLASKEYSKCIEKYLGPGDVMVTCTFGSLVDGKVKVKATDAKMARGEMVRYLAERQVADLEGAKHFNSMGYQFSEEHSTDNSFVFLKD